MATDDGNVEGAIWPMPKFRFQHNSKDTLRTSDKRIFRKICQRIITIKINQRKLQQLNHPKTITNGGSLAKLSNRVWNSPSYYVKVAKHNKLNKFRKLKGGEELLFPPII